MSEMTLKPNEKLDVRNILKDLDKYEPKRRGWTWRKPAPNLEMGPFTYHDVSEPLKQSVGLPRQVLRRYRPPAASGHHDRDCLRPL